MFILTTPTQYYTEILLITVKQEKKTKHWNGKKEMKLSLFMKHKIFYVENPK